VRLPALAEGYPPGRAASVSKSIRAPEATCLRVRQLVPRRLAGAYLNRQGYTRAVLETAKVPDGALRVGLLMEGQSRPRKDIKAPDGTLLEKAGPSATAAPTKTAWAGVACWKPVMDENDYMVKKWNEFIAA